MAGVPLTGPYSAAHILCANGVLPDEYIRRPSPENAFVANVTSEEYYQKCLLTDAQGWL
jgi:hypothetical protein